MAAIGRDLAKYFVHGLAFAILFLIVAVVWVVAFAILVIFGLWIGLIIGFVLFFALMGYVNAFITLLLWFPVRMGFLSVLGHGLLLFVALLPVNLVVLAVRLFVAPDLLISFGIFLVSAPILGVVAKRVAEVWEVHPEDEAVFGEMPGEPPTDEPRSD